MKIQKRSLDELEKPSDDYDDRKKSVDEVPTLIERFDIVCIIGTHHIMYCKFIKSNKHHKLKQYDSLTINMNPKEKQM